MGIEGPHWTLLGLGLNIYGTIEGVHLGAKTSDKHGTVHPKILDIVAHSEDLQINGLHMGNLEGLGGFKRTFTTIIGWQWATRSLAGGGYPQLTPPFSYIPRVTLKNITLTLGKLWITKATHLWKPFEET